MTPLWTGTEWTFPKIERVYQAISEIAVDEMGLEPYPAQLEIITSEQMVDAYTSIGLPIFYHHWSFGKHFTDQWTQYQRGLTGLAYEIVINCLKEGTKVCSEGKILNIEDVKLGDLLWNGTHYVPVTRINTSHQKTYNLQLANGIVLSPTSEHRHVVYSNTGRQIKRTTELTLDDYFLVPITPMAEIERPRAYLGDFRYFPSRTGFGERYGYQPYCVIPPDMTPELAELLGIVLGDGCVAHTMGTSFYISVGHTSEDYDQHVISLIKQVFQIEQVYVREKESIKVPGKMNKDIYICSDEIKSFLGYCGLDRVTAKNKRIPWSVWSSDRDCKVAFLRGLFDTDGCAKRMAYSCRNPDLGQDIGILLWSLGVANVIRQVNNKHNEITTIDLVSDGRKQFARLIDSQHKIKRFDLDRLLERDDKFMSDQGVISQLPPYLLEKHNNGLDISRGQLLKRIDDDEVSNFRYVKLVSITSNDHEDRVVDLTVDSSDHIFWANGVLTHNSNPCIAYLMEENTMTMQTLVISHAAFGHSHFFRNNYLFRQWTNAESIVDYLLFARDYIKKCEVREGHAEVESFLDSCHALMNYGINRYKRPAKLSPAKERKREEERDAYRQSKNSELAEFFKSLQGDEDSVSEKKFPKEPEENILFFCEKFAPDLPEWKREIIRIVRKISQYFYPQSLTRTMNEGCATYCHYRIMNRLHDKGLMTDGSMLEFLHSHTGVVFQPAFDDPRYSGLNPYTIGFAMMCDIERICKNPTDEDRKQFPDFAGCQDEMSVLREAWQNYRDESFVRQFLSNKLIRDLDLFELKDIRRDPQYVVTAIHDDRGYDMIRETLANNYERQQYIPEIEVVRVDPKTRELFLEYKPFQKRTLTNVAKMIKHIEALWGYPVSIHDTKQNLIT